MLYFILFLFEELYICFFTIELRILKQDMEYMGKKDHANFTYVN